MNILKIANRFARDEDGAITVDWVVLTSGIAALGIAVMLSVGGSTVDLSKKISTKITSTNVVTY